jgi:hypothetical protein
MTREPLNTDVIVVGAGPVGLMLGCELRLAGVNAIVFEQLEEPTGFSKALGIQGRGVDILQGNDARYEMGGGSERVGRWLPELSVATAAGPIRLPELMHSGRARLVDLSTDGVYSRQAAGWSKRVDVTCGQPTSPQPFEALLLRPDGFVAWAAEPGSPVELTAALTRWFGAPAGS